MDNCFSFALGGALTFGNYLLEQIIISAFPSHDFQFHREVLEDLYSRVYQSLDVCEDVWDLSSLLLRETVNHLFNMTNRQVTDLFETYQWVIRQKAGLLLNVVNPVRPLIKYYRQTAFQAKFFSEFHFSQNKVERRDVLDDKRELALALEVTDILDELKMIRQVIEDQEYVLRMMVDSIAKLNPKMVPGDGSQGFGNRLKVGNMTVHGDLIFNTTNSIAGAIIEPHIPSLRALMAGGIGQGCDFILQTEDNLVSLQKQLGNMQKDADDTYKLVCPR
jgi:hypothetical protein